MGMCVDQRWKQGDLTMVPRWSLEPLAAEQLKGSHVQNDTAGHHHSSILNGRLVYGDNQPGPV
jgi:hypothetical protein